MQNLYTMYVCIYKLGEKENINFLQSIYMSIYNIVLKYYTTTKLCVVSKEC